MSKYTEKEIEAVFELYANLNRDYSLLKTNGIDFGSRIADRQEQLLIKIQQLVEKIVSKLENRE